MFTVKINEQFEFELSFENGQITVDGEDQDYSATEINQGQYHIIKNNRSYNIEILEIDLKSKELRVRVNGNVYSVSIKDKFDRLLQQLGMTKKGDARINSIKAPMPGKVLEVKAIEGGLVKTGDLLLVLEAMKMENSLKSPGDGKINKVHVKTGDTVEKGQMLVTFDLD